MHSNCRATHCFSAWNVFVFRDHAWRNEGYAEREREEGRDGETERQKEAETSAQVYNDNAVGEERNRI